MPVKKKPKKAVKKKPRKAVKKKPKKENIIEKEIKKIGKEVKEDIGEVEAWVIERKKFLIKLGWVAGIIIVLLIISNFYLSVKGFG